MSLLPTGYGCASVPVYESNVKGEPVTNITAGPGIAVERTDNSVEIDNTGVLELTAGTNVTITGTKNNYTISASGGSGTVGTLAQVLLEGNSAGTQNIDMNGNDISNINIVSTAQLGSVGGPYVSVFSPMTFEGDNLLTAPNINSTTLQVQTIETVPDATSISQASTQFSGDIDMANNNISSAASVSATTLNTDTINPVTSGAQIGVNADLALSGEHQISCSNVVTPSVQVSNLYPFGSNITVNSNLNTTGSVSCASLGCASASITNFDAFDGGDVINFNTDIDMNGKDISGCNDFVLTGLASTISNIGGTLNITALGTTINSLGSCSINSFNALGFSSSIEKFRMKDNLMDSYDSTDLTFNDVDSLNNSNGNKVDLVSGGIVSINSGAGISLNMENTSAPLKLIALPDTSSAPLTNQLVYNTSNGVVSYQAIPAPPNTPNLSEVLAAGNQSGAYDIVLGDGTVDNQADIVNAGNIETVNLKVNQIEPVLPLITSDIGVVGNLVFDPAAGSGSISNVTGIAGNAAAAVEVRSPLDFLNTNAITNCPTITDIQGDITDLQNNKLDKSGALYVNSYYVNDNVNDIQTVVNEIGADQGNVIYVGAGSYGGADLSLTTFTNCAIFGPGQGGNPATICELAGGRGLSVTSGSSRVRIANLQVEGLLTLGATGNNYFQSVQAIGGLTIADGASGNYFFYDCEFSGAITVPSTFAGVIGFIRCNFAGVTFSLQNASPLQVQFTQAVGLGTTYPLKATYGGTNQLASGAVFEGVNSIQPVGATSFSTTGCSTLGSSLTYNSGSGALALVSQSGATLSTVTISSGGGGTVESVVGGSNITVDNTDPANPVVNVDAALTDITSVTGAASATVKLKAGTGGDARIESASGNKYMQVNDSQTIIYSDSVYFNNASPFGSSLLNVYAVQGLGNHDMILKTNNADNTISVIPGSSSDESYVFSKEKIRGPGSYDFALQPEITYNLKLNSGDGATQLTVSDTGVALGGALDMNTHAITDSAGVASSLELLGGELLLKDQQNTVLSTVPLPAPPGVPTLAEVLTEGNTANADIDMDANSLQNVGSVIGASTADTVVQAGSGHSLVLKSQDATAQLTVSDTGVALGGNLDMNTHSISNAVGVASSMSLVGSDLLLKDQLDNTLSTVTLPGSGDVGTLQQVLAQGNSAGNQDMTAVSRISGNSTTGILNLGAATGAYASVDNTLQEVTLSANKINMDFVGATPELLIDGAAGSAGQALISQGAGLAPVWGAAQNTQAASLACTDAAGATVYPIFTNSDTAGNKIGKVATGITYNDNTNTLITTTFQGALVGNADTATTASKATNIEGGVSGSMPYQTAADTTVLLPVGTDGQVLTVASGVPSWLSPSTIASQVAVGAVGSLAVVPLFCDNATPGDKSVLADADITFDPVTNTLTTTTFNGSLTGNADTATTANTATSAGEATNLASGLEGSIPYQSAPGVTTFVGIGSAGQVLTVNPGATAPTWETPSSSGGNLYQDDATNNGSVATFGTSVGSATVRLGLNLTNAQGATNSIAIGNAALDFVTAPTLAPDNVIAFGPNAGFNAGSDTDQQARNYVLIGNSAGYNLQFPQEGGVMIGHRAGENAKGFVNTFIGPEAGFGLIGDYTNAIGFRAAQNKSQCDDSTFIGSEVLNDIPNDADYRGRFVVGNSYNPSSLLNGIFGNLNNDGSPSRLGFGTNDPQLVRNNVNTMHIQGDHLVAGIYQGMSGFRANGSISGTINSTLFTQILATGNTFTFQYNQNLLQSNWRLKVRVQAYAQGCNVDTISCLQLTNVSQSIVITGETQGPTVPQGCAHSTVDSISYNTYILEDTFELTDFAQDDTIAIDVLVKGHSGSHILTGTFIANIELVRVTA